jgi:hypothetical protein
MGHSFAPSDISRVSRAVVDGAAHRQPTAVSASRLMFALPAYWNPGAVETPGVAAMRSPHVAGV